MIEPADHRGGDQLFFFLASVLVSFVDPYTTIGHSSLESGAELERSGFQFSYCDSISFEEAEELRKLEM